MTEEMKIINQFQEYSSWLGTLKDLDERLWSTSIAEGKWSVREIITHITFWDRHVLSKILPSVRNEKGMEFPEFGPFNKQAADYANSGISQSQLLKEAIEAREQVVFELNEMPIEKLTKPLTSNGIAHCPYTGTPYSLLYIVKEFVDHDIHHKNQIEQFLNSNR